MRKVLILLSIILISISTMNAQNEDGLTIYTFMVNSVPENFKYPLFGFFNHARGSQNSVHAGFVNYNQNNLSGSQIGLVNITGGRMKGAQIGLINSTLDSVKGLQLGLVNITRQKTKGTQIGLINSSGKHLKGRQLGFANVVNDLNGLQLGFVNISDTISSGVPIGFLSVVRKGGYRAIEISVSEMFPINISYKIGVKSWYTSFISSYSPAPKDHFAFGIGFGSILPVSETIYLNPEIMTQNIIKSKNHLLVSSVLNVGFPLFNKIHIHLGPSLVWEKGNGNEDKNKEFFTIKKWETKNNSTLMLGARIGLRYNFTHF